MKLTASQWAERPIGNNNPRELIHSTWREIKKLLNSLEDMYLFSPVGFVDVQGSQMDGLEITVNITY